MITPNIQETTPAKRGENTYRLDFENGRIFGKISGREALVQWVRKILMTEKDAYGIYTDYGCGAERLVGHDFLYASSMLKKNIIEAVLADARVLSVSGFTFEREKDSFYAEFNVNTIYGEISEEVRL